MQKILIAAFVLFFVSAAICAEKPVSITTTPVHLSLFKNGLGFLTREGELPKGDSTILIEGLPEAIHGTFWVTASSANVTNVTAFLRDKEEQATASSLSEIIRANVGQTVEVQIGDKDLLRGKIAAIPEPDVRATDTARTPYNSYNSPKQPAASIFLLETSDGTVALNLSDVRRVRVPDGSMQTLFWKKIQEAALQMQVRDAANQPHIRTHYLTRGITWAPSSEIDISDPQKARLSAKAEILNELEDINGISIYFITGFPNLQFSDVTDPMALRGDLAGFLSSLRQRGNYRGRSDVVMQQATLSNLALSSEEALPGYSVTAPEGETREELFFYEQKAVTLKKGERGYFLLYTLEVPYEHVYEWKIPDTLNTESSSYLQQNTTPSQEVVWHSLRLSNTGANPWTTAPATIVQQGQILGQDVMYYTSPGGKTLVKVTQAPDIHAEQAEYEIDRQSVATKLYGYGYDLVTVKGLLKATNFKNKDVTLTITKELSGEVIKSIPQAHVEQTALGLKKANPQNVLTWELPVAPRGKTEIEYQYKVYVRE